MNNEAPLESTLRYESRILQGIQTVVKKTLLHDIFHPRPIKFIHKLAIQHFAVDFKCHLTQNLHHNVQGKTKVVIMHDISTQILDIIALDVGVYHFFQFVGVINEHTLQK